MIVFYTNNISPHQLPLAHEVAKCVGYENFVYVGDEIAWRGKVMDAGRIRTQRRRDAEGLLETCEVMYTSRRDLELIEYRAAKGLKTFYYAERWFKPIPLRGIKIEGWRLKVGEWYITGWVRLLIPNYRRMARRFVMWANGDPNARVLAVGPHAKRDFLKLGVRADKLVPWGYFVEPSIGRVERVERVEKTLRVLWAGRDIPLKHVSDIERAVVLANKNLTSALHLHLDSTPISFTKLTGVSPAEVRAAMRSHDTFVFASNAQEGWGAVVSEALEEGMNVICSEECGAGPAILPRARLFKCGDVCALAKLLEAEYRGELPQCSIGDWTAAKAAERLCNLS